MQGMLILEYNLYVLEWERVPKKILITENNVQIDFPLV